MQQHTFLLRFVRAFAIGFGLACAFWLALNQVPSVPDVPTVHAQQIPAPCSQSASLTTTGTGTVIPTTGSGSSSGCVGWRLTWYVTGFSGLTIALQGSQDNSSWANIGSTYVQEGTNPTVWTSSTGSNTIVVRAYFPYVRVNVSSVTGSGRVTWLLYGYPGTSAQMDLGGGSGPGGSCSSLGGDLTGTCAAAVVVQAQSGKVTFDSSGNVVAAGSYTSGSGSGLTGKLALTGATSGSTVNVTVGASTAAGTVTIPGVTGTAAYSASAGTSGHCVEYASDGLGLIDAGSACGSSSGGNPYLNPSVPTPIVTANWSDFNMGSCSRNDSGNFEQILSNATASNNVCGRTIAFPAGSFTRTLAVIPLLAGTNFGTAGFGITDGTKVATCSIQFNSGSALNGAKCTNSSTCGSNYSVTTPYVVSVGTIMFFRMTDDGAGNVACSWSQDGSFFTQLWTDKDTTGAGGFMTPTNLIYLVNSATSNKVEALTVIGYQ